MMHFFNYKDYHDFKIENSRIKVYPMSIYRKNTQMTRGIEKSSTSNDSQISKDKIIFFKYYYNNILKIY